MGIKISQLRDMTQEELDQKKGALKQELFDLRHQIKMGRVEKPHRVKETKRAIARIETILRERKKG